MVHPPATVAPPAVQFTPPQWMPPPPPPPPQQQLVFFYHFFHFELKFIYLVAAESRRCGSRRRRTSIYGRIESRGKKRNGACNRGFGP
jgi:hypothetical protein